MKMLIGLVQNLMYGVRTTLKHGYTIKKGEIYIQVTPVYRWHFAKPKSNDKFSCYSQFVKEYKIIYKAKIERDNAIQWLNKCKEIINIIEMNQRKSEKGRL